MKSRIWFNKGFSNLENLLQDLKTRLGDEILLFGSHTLASSAISSVVDKFCVEPATVSQLEYLNYCLDFCSHRMIDIFVPTREAVFLSAYSDKFKELGVTLAVAGSAEVLGCLDNKVETYKALQDKIGCIPKFAEFSSYNDFLREAEMFPSGTTLCMKPAVGVFGAGFKILSKSRSTFDCTFDPSGVFINIEMAKDAFSSRDSFPPFILMPYLNGEEWSVDCLAADGAIISASCRKKERSPSRCQLFVENPELVEYARQITEHFNLSGIYNVQFRYHDGVPYLLELNARISGGLHYLLHSGVSFVYLWMQLLRNEIDSTPIPFPSNFKISKVDNSARHEIGEVCV